MNPGYSRSSIYVCLLKMAKTEMRPKISECEDFETNIPSGGSSPFDSPFWLSLTWNLKKETDYYPSTKPIGGFPQFSDYETNTLWLKPNWLIWNNRSSRPWDVALNEKSSSLRTNKIIRFIMHSSAVFLCLRQVWAPTRMPKFLLWAI